VRNKIIQFNARALKNGVVVEVRLAKNGKRVIRVTHDKGLCPISVSCDMEGEADLRETGGDL